MRKTQQTLKIKDMSLVYMLRKNRRSKTLRLTIKPGGDCTVSAPHFVTSSQIEKFLTERADWILKKIHEMSKITPPKSKKEERVEYITYKEQARGVAETKVKHFATQYGFSWNKIAIRNQKTRWGSCSRKGNLNFSYKLALLPEDLADYLVVHEVCHLKEFNHSKRFWDLVAQTIPDYKAKRTSLKKFSADSTVV